MTKRRYRIGDYVTHPTRPEWGPGKILEIAGSKVTVYFRDIPGDDPHKAVKTIATDRVALEPAALKGDTLLDNLPPYEDGTFEQLPRKRVTLKQGIAHFHSLFPFYFEDRDYIGDLKNGERAYKLAAHELFVETLGEGRLRDLLASGALNEARRRALAVEGRVNLVSPFEKAAFRDGLRANGAAHQYLSALDDLLRTPSIDREAFERYLAAVEALPSREGKTDPAKWTVATILPYLAQPTRFMFLKPTVTKDCAARLTYDLNYQPHLNWGTYAKLLKMSEYLLDELRQYGARDFIDVQSFIWVIGGGWDGG